MLVDTTHVWTVGTDSKKKGEELYYDMATSKAGKPMLRVTSYSDFDTLTTFRASVDEKTRKTYDKNVEKSYVVDTLGTNLYIAYQSTNRIVTVSSRDLY